MNNLGECHSELTPQRMKHVNGLEPMLMSPFSALLHKKLLSRRTLEGRIQRALVLYDQGLQINDPMEFFEEITRYRLI